MSRVISIVLATVIALPAVAGSGIRGTKHDLSITGTGAVRSTSETEICIFCHAGHNAAGSRALWNRNLNTPVAYRPYDSPTMSARPGQPDGASRMCLSCHDGTLAVGAVGGRARAIRMIGTDAAGRIRQLSKGNLGTDLSGDHPVSISYRRARQGDRGVARTRLKPRPQRELLDSSGKVQCTSCHDPHVDRSAAGNHLPPFWRGSSFSEVCTSCHDAPTVVPEHDDPNQLTQSCGSCHVGHGLPRQALLARAEEDACYDCHGDSQRQNLSIEGGRLSPTAKPVRVDDLFDLPYTHPVEATLGSHRADEDMSRGGARSERHVECVDCHVTHGSRRTPRRKGNLSSPRARFASSERSDAESTCFSCHGNNPNLPLGQTDKAEEFGPAAVSAHPVEASSPRGRASSLLQPWLGGDVMTCSDCHGPQKGDDRVGPHGSQYRWILKSEYVITDGSVESENTYQACYQCHSRSTILSDRTFKGHSQHVVSAQVSCYTCHDSHASLDYPSLIRFNKDFRYAEVKPSASGRMEYNPVDGTCTLSCHDVEHEALGYR